MSTSGTKRRMGSWADYDAHRQNRNNGSTGGSSNRMGSSAAASSSGTSSSIKKRSKNTSSSTVGKKSKSPPTGIEALYVDAPHGIDTRLQFQWMRPHPASAILAAAAAAKGSKNAQPALPQHVIESARMVERYRRARHDAARATGKKNDRNNTGHHQQPDQQMIQQHQKIEISVELTSLFDPPLLSEWTPGIDIGISYNDDDDSCGSDGEDDYVSETARSESNALHADEVNAAVDKIVQLAAKEMTNQINDQEATASANIGKSGESIKQLFGNVSTDSLLEYLPSRILLRKILDTTAADANATIDTEEQSYLALSILSLVFLADSCRTEEMGRHILSVLAPVLFSSERAAAECKKGGLSKSNTSAMQRLCSSLINNCQLGELTKGDLHKLVEKDNMIGSGELSEIMDELIIGLGRAYHNQYQK